MRRLTADTTTGGGIFLYNMHSSSVARSASPGMPQSNHCATARHSSLLRW